MREDIEIEAIHHHPANTICDGCHDQMIEMGSTIVREEAKFIPAKMMKVQHIEHAYECKMQKRFITKGQIKRGKAPQPPIQRSIASPSVLAKVMYDKFSQYLPLYRQVKEWERYTRTRMIRTFPLGHSCLTRLAIAYLRTNEVFDDG